MTKQFPPSKQRFALLTPSGFSFVEPTFPSLGEGAFFYFSGYGSETISSIIGSFLWLREGGSTDISGGDGRDCRPKPWESN
tara:strand:+ start:286 stop:528 length:243 start_codon:yes stop_codon:yes gene_type:complete